MWNEQIAAQIDEWESTSFGKYVSVCRGKLLRRLISGWPRRGRKIVVIGCGAGRFLEMLWEDGFDVTGFDTSEGLLSRASSTFGSRADYHLGAIDVLPFEDGQFDYSVIPYCYELIEKPEEALSEALRIAVCGTVVLFTNRLSLLPFYASKIGLPPQCWNALFPWTVYKNAVRAESKSHITMRTMLPTIPSMWRSTPLLSRVNAQPLIPPFGMLAGLTIEKPTTIPMTPIWLKQGVAEESLVSESSMAYTSTQK